MSDVDKEKYNKNYYSCDSQLSNLKIPPYSLEAEQSVLGGLMLDNNSWDYVVDRISVNDFFNYSHQLIYKEMHFLSCNKKPIDLITLSESLERKGKIDDVGGFAYLAELSKNISSTANIYAYADIIHERAVVREIITVSQEIVNSCYNPLGRNSIDLLDFAESKIFKISENCIKKSQGPKVVNSILKQTMLRIENICKSPMGITGVSSGYNDLDKKIFGFQKSDLIIIASRPSMGKTTFAMNICENIAMTEIKPVLVFSLEMSCEQIMIRMLSSLSRVDQIRIRTGRLSNDDWARISSTIEIIMDKCSMYIDDSSGLTPYEIRSRSRKLFKEHNGLSLIMVDYLQLIRVPSLSHNRTLEITEISRSLKELAKELHVPVLALSQLNRSLEQRSDKRPINSDLRESGSIEQDADLIMFIYRDEIYRGYSNMKGVAEVIIGKQRNGPIGTVRLTFNAQWSRFDNYINNDY